MFEYSSELLGEIRAKAEPVSDEYSLSKITEYQSDHVICFTPKTLIATPRGARPVETLKVGDLVMTRDHGMQPIRWIQSRSVSGIGQFAPIRLQKGVLTGMEDDLVVSPRHRVLLQGYRAELLFG
ncbi:MAG TPA: Hint domain-containing protein, partial [Paracoccaceae bacterium]|nr:Hint domain-containing protein [Paracoccaceae bacterium]